MATPTTQVRVEDEISGGNEEGPEVAGGIAAMEGEAIQCGQPMTHVPRGRPAKNRMKKGEMRRKLGRHKMGGLPDIVTGPRHVIQPVKCLGHYLRMCCKAHT